MRTDLSYSLQLYEKLGVGADFALCTLRLCEESVKANEQRYNGTHRGSGHGYGALIIWKLL